MSKLDGVTRPLMWLMALLLAALAAGCGGGGGGGAPILGLPGVISFVVTPATATVPITGFQQFTAIETYSDGTSRNVTATSTWTSGTLAVAANPIAGLATGLTAGTTLITATSGGRTATATLNVNAATSVSFKVMPKTHTIPVTGYQQYTAIETFSDGTSYDRTSASAWTSVNVPAGGPAVVTLSADGSAALVPVACVTSGGGCATGNVVGTSTITATYGVYIVGYAGVPGSTDTVASVLAARTATLTVNAAKSTKFEVIPVAATISVGGKQQYAAIETFSDGKTFDRTTVSAWTSSAPGVATVCTGIVTPSCLVTDFGLATGVTAGGSAITASYGVYIAGYAGVPGSTDTVASVLAARTAALTVTGATVVSINVAPPAATILIGGTQQYTLTALYSDGSSGFVTASGWVSANPLVAANPVAGLATGFGAGTSAITATYTDPVNSVVHTSPLSPAAGGALLTVNALVPPIVYGPAGAPPTLGTASTYGLIASTAMTIPSSPLAHIYGDVAITTTDAFTGFALAGTIPLPTSIYVTPKTIPGINSTVHGNTAAIPTLILDLTAAYNDLWNRVPAANALTTPASAVGKGGGTFLAGTTDLSGFVLDPGVYKFGLAAAADTISLSNAALGPLVLDAHGNPDAVFVFIASDITTTTNNVILQGGAQAKNVFWVMTASATIGNGTVNIFQGTVVAGTAITVAGTNVEGRMLAGATIGGPLTITAAGSTITVPQ